MENTSKVIQFGEEIEGYDIPVLNEREIRAAAGILFVFMLISLMFILFKGNFIMIKYVIIIFLTDLLVRVFINPAFAPTLIIGRWIVSRQTPEYVGAAQKKFAWKIGLVLAGLMFLLMVVVNSYSIITGLSCLVCLVFLFFESAFGICLGCLFYGLFYKEKAQYCAGEICDSTKKGNMRGTSWAQIAVIFAFAGYIIAGVVLFNQKLAEQPTDLWHLISASLSK